MNQFLAKFSAALLALLAVLVASSSAFGAASIVIQNNDAPGVGFNDTTPVAPVGGNPGTTLGQQRLNAFQFAANIWGATLTSSSTINVQASWAPLPCTSSSAVLGSAGTVSLWRDFPGAPFAGTWYGAALANALSGTDLNPGSPEIEAQFNVNLGNAGCLTGTHFYLGLDNNHGTDEDLATVLLHEFSHGLGFQTATNASTGAQLNLGDGSGPHPSIYDRFLFDDTTGKTWVQMTNAERQASALNTGNLVWSGPQVTTDTASVLGTPRLKVNSPPSIAGNDPVGTASFGPALSSPGITGTVVQALDGADVSGPLTTDGCSALTNSGAVTGKIALIDRGTCTFVTKVKNAQNAGAVGVIIANNTSGILQMGGTDATITIPSVLVSQVDGNSIRGQLGAGVNATLLLDTSMASGTDTQGRPLMFAPNPVQSGSSVSHWDTSEFPNQLMEPDISPDLTHNVTPPQDLTFSLLRDVGWPTVATPAPTPPANDNFSNAQVIAGCSGSVTGTNVGATKEVGEPNHSPDNGGGSRSVWYQWQAPSSGNTTITTAGSSFDTVLAVYTGTAVGSLTPIAKNDDVSLEDKTSSVTFSASAGTVYRIAVDGYNNNGSGGDVGSIVLNWTESGCVQAPTLLTEEGTNQAVALDSVTQVRGPFRVMGLFNFSADHHTRVMLFTSNLGLAQGDDLSVISVQAQDASLQSYTLPIENVGTVPGLNQASYIVVRLTDQLPAGQLAVSVTLRGAVSNSATIGIVP